MQKRTVSVRSSVKPDDTLSTIDGKPYKMLKRHLALNGSTPETHREVFGLPKNYPMAAAAYAEKHRALATQIGLGNLPRKLKSAASKAIKAPRGKYRPVKTER